ncbi:NAD(P)-binding protein [Paraphaeosphaeria sporulosa]|uniref:NAD(P)-binding protein n=1 Tax=Paraphaeosphaeria sporulosa TaxID=1460663 RepID=A0A177CGF2_9PLEO|nr:NAD(P)-binding protein [Paraphaeosphaeria sporulosa]OAG06665.1 NAD(P)-binding protein [Paraphaeosphaeria sporulosa]
MSTKPLILLTGATGHIGFRTLVVALRANYAVRVAIRKPDQEAKIRNASSIQPYLSSLSFALVPNMAAPSAFSSAIKGATYVIHVASPIPMKPDVQVLLGEGKTFREVMYDPAVKGTLEVLRAAAGEQGVRRVVITASGNILACTVGVPDCKPTDIRPCPTDEEADAMTVPGVAYKTSKILAVSAAQKFMEEEDRGFDMVITCPGYVQGAHELAGSVEELRTSTSQATVDIATGQELGMPPLAPPLYNQIWVEDVARAHVEALANANVKADDVLVLAGNGPHSTSWEEVGKMVAEMFGKEVEEGVLKPKMDQKGFSMPFDGSGTEEKLGFQFAPAEVWVKETVAQYLQLRGTETA